MSESDKQVWSFDVSSLMVLINEAEEQSYRLSRRSLMECLAGVPVIGLQNYIRSYDLLLEPSPFNYFSPYGCKSALLRNMDLANSIKHGKLLEDKRFNVFKIPDVPRKTKHGTFYSLVAWVLVTWILFAGLVVFTVKAPNTSWIGIANCAATTGWSILLRLVEHFNIEPAPVDTENITAKDGPDAVFIVGRNNSAFVLEGSRESIKDLTTRGLTYKARPLGIPSGLWQSFTRLGSLLILLLIFTTIPNGTTMDQVAFIIINLLAQTNVVVGQYLHSWCCLMQFDKIADTKVETRTHVYGELVRRFKDVEAKTKWVDDCDLIPKTEVWDEWKSTVMKDDTKDAKVIYQEISEEHSKTGRS